jgi:hypothetical protein
MEITETLLVANRTRTTYVGQSIDGKPPMTLRLSIPENFDRVTFGDEFHGRRFGIVDHRPVTRIPWPPGERELTFTYRIPREESFGLFRRPLDLPSAEVRIRVRGKYAEQISCNLPRASATGDEAVFASADNVLPAGFTVELNLGALPLPWMQYARWGSVAALAALVAANVVAPRFRRVRSNRQDAIDAERLNRPMDNHRSASSNCPKRRRRRYETPRC